MALMLGFVLVGLLGIGHHFGLMTVRKFQPASQERPQTAIMVAFLGLLALHTLEILAFAAIYRGLLAWGGVGGLAGADHAT